VTTNPFHTGSIRFRLLVAASLSLLAALAITFFVLTNLFRDTVTRNFDIVLMDHVDELLSLMQRHEDGSIELNRHPADPRFLKPASGWYWTISVGNGWNDRSRSLGANDMPAGGPSIASGDIRPHHIADHSGQLIRIIGKQVHDPNIGRELTVLLSGPAVVVEDAVADFNGALLLSLAGIGLALVLAVVFQVSFGLRPLRAIGKSLAAIRAGDATRLEGDFPDEIAPLASELNALLDHNRHSIARTRTRVSDLAHALKTPIAVLKNTADELSGPEADSIRDQVTMMNDSVNHHLAQARIAGTAGLIGARTPLRDLAERLRRTLAQIYADKALNIELHVAGNPVFRGEHQDLAEMLGNLMDNACKWAASRIQVDAADDGHGLLISVSDDGPGIPDDGRDEALGRGKRLDESTPGDGLGLAIVRDIAGLYGGTLDLASGPQGGVSARLRLPAA